MACLTQFKEFMKAANAGEKGLYEKIEKNFYFKTHDQFEALVNEQLKKTENVEDSKLLVNLLENSIKPCLDKLEINKKQELLEKINKAIKDGQLQELKKFFKDLLDSASKQVVIEELWDEYFRDYEGFRNTANAFAKRIEGAFGTNYSQSQADPLKRVGMILFEMLYTFLDYALYKSSNGKERLSPEYEFKSGEAEDSFAEMNKMQYGLKNVAHGTGAAPKANPK